MVGGDDQGAEPELEGVTSWGREVEVPGRLRLYLLHATRWSTGLVLTWALVGPQEDLDRVGLRRPRSRSELALIPWALEVEDDLGTRYRVDGASGGGAGERRQRADVRMSPRVPAHASALTCVLRDLDTGEEQARVTVPLGAA